MMNAATLKHIATAIIMAKKEVHISRPLCSKWRSNLQGFRLSMRGTRAASRRGNLGAGAHDTAPERTSILNVIVPADGTRAATVGNGDFGTSPIFGQLSDKLLLARIQQLGCRT
jgi:hypothetical protein